MAAAKWPTHYLGMNSLSRPSRSLFFICYDSFAEWEKDNMAMMKDATLSAPFDRASQADGELLSKYETGVFTYNDEEGRDQASAAVTAVKGARHLGWSSGQLYRPLRSGRDPCISSLFLSLSVLQSNASQVFGQILSRITPQHGG
jgi:hypothetical protein